MKNLNLKEILYKVLKWIKDVVPTAGAMATLVYNYMMKLIDAEKRAHDETKLDKKLLENELEVKKDNEGKSDADIIMDAADSISDEEIEPKPRDDS